MGSPLARYTNFLPNGDAAVTNSSPFPTYFPRETPGLVAILNNRGDFLRAASERWYRVPVQSAPPDQLSIRWIAFYLTAPFGKQKWSVRHWAAVHEIAKARRVDLIPSDRITPHGPVPTPGPGQNPERLFPDG
jgi:hypothetical protein